MESSQELWKGYYSSFDWAKIDLEEMTLTVLKRGGAGEEYDELSVVGDTKMNDIFMSVGTLSGPVSVDIKYPNMILDSNIFCDLVMNHPVVAASSSVRESTKVCERT